MAVSERGSPFGSTTTLCCGHGHPTAHGDRLISLGHRTHHAQTHRRPEREAECESKPSLRVASPVSARTSLDGPRACLSPALPPALCGCSKFSPLRASGWRDGAGRALFRDAAASVWMERSPYMPTVLICVPRPAWRIRERARSLQGGQCLGRSCGPRALMRMGSWQEHPEVSDATLGWMQSLKCTGW